MGDETSSRRQEREMGQKWDEEKAEAFAAHLYLKIFELHPCEVTIEEEKKLLKDSNIPTEMIASAKPFTIKEVRAAIRVLNPKKARRYNLAIT